MELMEQKKTWNLRVFESVAAGFDEVINDDYRGDKGTTASAACLMFLLATPAVRQRFVDLIKLAEGRGLDGTVYEAAKKAVEVTTPAPAAGGERVLEPVTLTRVVVEGKGKLRKRQKREDQPLPQDRQVG